MQRGWGFFFVAFVALAFARDASALVDRVTIQFNNGDKLSGKLLEENSQTLVLEADVVGEVILSRDQVKKIDRKKPAAKKPGEEGGDAEGELAQSSSRIRSMLAPLTFADWQKRLEFGFSTQSGRKDKTDFSLNYNMQRRSGKNQYRLISQVFYGEADEAKSTDRQYGSFRWRRDISPGVFYETNSFYSADDVKSINYNVEQKFGLGYRFINSQRFKLSSGAGASGRLRDDATRNGEFDYLVDFFQEVDYSMNQRLRFSQNVRVAVPFADSDQYTIDFRAAMISDVSEAMNLSIRYELQFDNSLIGDNRQDQRLISALGYSF